ncbi:MAG: glycosyltransferase family 2 protein [Methylococcales bacterium]|nr:glycosyltransferase family 2 protein [Methylococcales bacterium]
MLVSIVIVNFNAGELITACIESIIKETRNNSYEIIVVDNDSSDESIAVIKNKFPSVNVIETGANLGFAAGNNIGFEAAKGDYILVLNPDTLITDRAIDYSLTYLMDHPEVGVLGCKVLWETGEIQSTLIRFPALTSILINLFIPYKIMRTLPYLGRSRYAGIDTNLHHDVDVVAGCFMLLPHVIIDEVGGMDDDFFMFGEEIEWCWRISQTGKKIRYYPENTIIHTGGGCSSTLSYRKELLIAKGGLMVFKKTRGALVATIANLLMLLRDGPRACIFLVCKLLVPKKADKMESLKISPLRFIYLLQYLIGIEKEI